MQPCVPIYICLRATIHQLPTNAHQLSNGLMARNCPSCRQICCPNAEPSPYCCMHRCTAAQAYSCMTWQGPPDIFETSAETKSIWSWVGRCRLPGFARHRNPVSVQQPTPFLPPANAISPPTVSNSCPSLLLRLVSIRSLSALSRPFFFL